MHASIICACLPYCRHFLISFGAKFLQSTRTGDSRNYASRLSVSRKAGEGGTTTSGIPGDGQQAPKRGDERDFVPLVEYRGNQKWDKQTTTSAVSATSTFGSKDSL